MRTTGFESLPDARRELAAHGYSLGFSSPGRPALWAKAGARERDYRAIALATGDTEYRIVPYPLPATCTPEQLSALQARDKIIGYEADEVMVVEAEEDLSFLD
jgi:hypothetical protein